MYDYHSRYRHFRFSATNVLHGRHGTEWCAMQIMLSLLRHASQVDASCAEVLYKREKVQMFLLFIPIEETRSHPSTYEQIAHGRSIKSNQLRTVYEYRGGSK